MKRLCTLFAVSLGLSRTLAATEFDAAKAINQVGLELFRNLGSKTPGTNLVLSPYSIESALALVYAGSAGETRAEMAKALHFPADNAALQKSFAALRASLDEAAARGNKITQRAQSSEKIKTVLNGLAVELEPEPVKSLEWHVANRLFGQTGYAFRDSFLTLMRAGFAAPFEPRDFRREPEAARLAINGWVEEQTRQKIRDLIAPNGITRDTRLVLVNALYLKAAWEKTFNAKATIPAPFYVANQPVRDVPTMRQHNYYPYSDERDVTVVVLPYLGGDLQFTVLLPKPDVNLTTLATSLTPERLAGWARLRDANRSTYLALHLPRFRTAGGTVQLGPALQKIGLRSAFDLPARSANFDGIAPRRPDDYLYISEVFHQTFIALDEEGTEAAAATAVIMMLGSSMPPKPIEVRIDRPFLFAIQHRISGACLFLGRITDPR